MGHKPDATAEKADAGAGAVRSRRFRQRAKVGACVVPVVVGPAVVTALLASGRLTESQSRDRGAVAVEIAAVMQAWAARWDE